MKTASICSNASRSKHRATIEMKPNQKEKKTNLFVNEFILAIEIAKTKQQQQ